MKKILPLVALLASCASTPIPESPAMQKKSIEEVAEDTCSRLSEQELVELTYRAVTIPQNLMFIDRKKGCADYEMEFQKDGVTFFVSARTGNSLHCYETVEGLLPRDVKAGLLFTEVLPLNIRGSGVYAFRLYRDITPEKIRGEDYIRTNGFTFSCNDNCTSTKEKFDSYLRFVCTENERAILTRK